MTLTLDKLRVLKRQAGATDVPAPAVAPSQPAPADQPAPEHPAGVRSTSSRVGAEVQS